MGVTVVALVVYIFVIYCLLKFRYNYWKKRQIPGPKAGLFVGLRNHFNRFYGPHYAKENYDTYPDEPVVGLFTVNIPVLLVKDLNMIEDILVKNFSKFPSRRIDRNTYFDMIRDRYFDPPAENLFRVEGPEWKPLRQKLSPVFTSAKLKQMFDMLTKCTDRLVTRLNDAAEKNEPVEFYVLTGQFTIDAMILCLFSIDSNTLLDEDSEFQEIVPTIPKKTHKDFTKIQLIKLISAELFKSIRELLILHDKEDAFLLNVIKKSIDHRKPTGVKKNDFLDLIINLKDHPEQLKRKKVPDDLLLAQALFFFDAGQDLPISHAFYELASNLHIQDKLRNEIAEASVGGRLNYNNISSMKYLDKVVKVSKELRVMIPVYAIQHDPKIYPEPEKFDPERFDEKVASLRPKMSYLPFGDGPRICIAQRFVLLQIKLCLAAVIKNFSLEICQKTFKVDVIDMTNRYSGPDGETYLRVKKI